MKKVPAFLLFVLVMFCSMGGVFVARSSQEERELSKSAKATEAPREVSGGAVAQMPTKIPASEKTPAPTANSSQKVGTAISGQENKTLVTTAIPTAVPTVAPTATPTPTPRPTPVPTEVPTPEVVAEIAGVSREEMAQVAELMGVSEADVELVLEKAEENGYTFDVEAIKSGEVDVQELWGIVTEALGEKRAYELLIKALGSNLF